MNIPTVIGFSGKLGTGKDYLAKHILPHVIKTQYGIDADIRIVAVADQLKYELAARDPTLSYELMYVQKTTDVRKKLQQYGTENGRNKYGPNMWLQALSIRMEVDRQRHVGDRPLLFVITDIRYENEVDFVQNVLGGLVIRIDAPARNLARLTQEGLATTEPHISEIALDSYKFAYKINNDIGIEDTVGSALSIILCNYVNDCSLLAAATRIHDIVCTETPHDIVAYMKRNNSAFREFVTMTPDADDYVERISELIGSICKNLEHWADVIEIWKSTLLDVPYN